MTCFADPKVVTDQRLAEIDRLSLALLSPIGARAVKEELISSVRLLKSEVTRQSEEIDRLNELLNEHETDKLIPLSQ